MRTKTVTLWAALVAVLALALALARPASAQLINFNSTNPQIVNQPTVQAASVRLPTAPSGPTNAFFGFLPKFSGISNQRFSAHPALPADKDMPGLDYLKNFNYRVAQRAH